MKRALSLASILLLILGTLSQTAQAAKPGTPAKTPAKNWLEPPLAEPRYDGAIVEAPAGASLLFGGKDTDSWLQLLRKEDPDQTPRFRWKVENGYMEVVPKTGMIQTSKRCITSGHLHIEWATPAEVKGNGQGRGNSGVFIEGLPELQVLDSFNNKTYFDGQAAAFYKVRPPSVNASRGPGLWQSYDIHIRRAQVEGEKIIRPATVTVYHNNVLVQDSLEFPSPVQAGTLKLQDHLNPVRYRNIWFAPSQAEAQP